MTARWLNILSCALGVMALTAGIVYAEPRPAAPPPPVWDREVVARFASLPVLDGGRVKPLATYAGFTLLKFNGKRACKTPSGRSLPPAEWLMDYLFYPEAAKQYKVFRVEDSAVMTAIGLPFTKKRDRYAYADIHPGRTKLLELAQRYSDLPEKARTPIQNQLIHLAKNCLECEALFEFLEFARRRFSLGGEYGLGTVFEEQREYRLSEVLERGPRLYRHILELQRDASPLDPAVRERDLNAAIKVGRQAQAVAAGATAIALFPPRDDAKDAAWSTPSELIEGLSNADSPAAEELRWIAALEELVAARDAPAAFAEQMEALHEAVVERARTRGEYGAIELEVAYYKAKLLHRALILYILAFLLVAASWLRPARLIARPDRPGARALIRGGNVVLHAAVIVPTLLLAASIVMRCIIRGRPPATTLYETILFTAFTAIAVSLWIEWVNRRKIALSLAACLGVVGLFLANKYEVKEGVDTMPGMIAVLDTNFWLAVHVTTIVIGYAAGLLAGALGHVYVMGKVLGARKGDPRFYRDLDSMTYGVLCFALLFSVVGTVTGGIWANESWGRFWGWDPKENGALMIVLWQLAILHARSGGYIRAYGVNLAAIFGGVIVAFSWFGINLLNVGLHTYGFTQGVYRTLMAFYLIEGLVLLAGCAAGLREWRRADQQP